MRNVFLIIVLGLLPLISDAVSDMPYMPVNAVALPPQRDAAFTFAVLGDFRPAERDRPYSEASREIFSDLNVIGPSFIMSVGDAYYGYGGSFPRFRNEIDHFISRTKKFGVPFFDVIGNHELGGNGQREKYVRERFGKFYGSFDWGNSHFVVLNTEEKGRAGGIYGAQLKWLAQDLALNKNSQNIFVFMHRPLFPALAADTGERRFFTDTRNRDTLHALFRKFGVKIVFAGHEHLFREKVVDGIRYIITGGGGAPLYQVRSRGGFYHYLLVDVEGRNVSVETLTPDSLELHYVSGNDGFNGETVVDVLNTSPVDISIGNLEVKMPLAEASRYSVEGENVSHERRPGAIYAEISKITNNGDGSATVGVKTRIGPKGRLRITVGADMGDGGVGN
jgi:hypothetical protein